MIKSLQGVVRRKILLLPTPNLATFYKDIFTSKVYDKYSHRYKRMKEKSIKVPKQHHSVTTDCTLSQ